MSKSRCLLLLLLSRITNSRWLSNFAASVLSTKYTDVSTYDQCFAKSRILTSPKEAYTRRAMAAIEKFRGLKRKLELEDDEEQNTIEEQEMQVST